MIGIGQLVIILIIVLLLFGAGKLPKIMKDLGIGLREFKKAFEGKDSENFENNEKIIDVSSKKLPKTRLKKLAINDKISKKDVIIHKKKKFKYKKKSS